MTIPYLDNLDKDTIIEFCSLIFSLATFWIGARQYIITWPITIAISLLNIRLYYTSSLYDRCLLSLISMASSLYGWYCWRYGGKKHTKLDKITTTSPQERSGLLTLSPFYMALLYSILLYLQGRMPFASAFCNTLSMIGMWMTAHKKLETYLIWFLVNIISIYVFYQVGRWFFMIKYTCYLILSVKGYHLWRKQYHTQRDIQTTS